MNEPLAIAIVSLLALMWIALLWQGILLVTIAHRLDRLSSNLKRQDAVEILAAAPKPIRANTTLQTDFDRFLAEEPARQQLGKKEQSTAYRLWRKQNGLTWNA